MISELKDVFGKLKPQFDDDVVNRLNYIYTVFIIAVCALVVGAKQYVGKPLQCWVPAEFGKGEGWERYAESYCLVENTYYMDYEEQFPNHDTRVSKEINYYQWVPIILSLQALMFYLPRIIWSALNVGSGLHIPGIIENVMNVTKDKDKNNRRALKSDEDVHKAEDLAAQHMVNVLKFSEPPQYVDSEDSFIVEDENSPPRYSSIQTPKQSLLHQGKRSATSNTGTATLNKPFTVGYMSTGAFVFVKLLYVLNVVGQFLIMNSLFTPGYTLWGFEILRDLLNNREWDDSGNFPRVTYCDFDIVGLLKTRRYTVQCVLVINMLNEKIFLFLWLWFFVLAILNVLSFVYTLAISFTPGSHKSFLRIYLEATKIDMAKDTKDIGGEAALTKFVQFLRPDGILTLRLISENVGDLICSDMVVALWNAYWGIKPEPAPQPPSTDPKMTQSMDGLHETVLDNKKVN